MRMISRDDFVNYTVELSKGLKRICDEIDKLKEKNTVLDATIRNIITILDTKFDTPEIRLESITELKDFIETSVPGSYDLSIKDVKLFRLLVGDEESLLYYPNFVELNIPHVQAYEGMLVSKYSNSQKDWI